MTDVGIVFASPRPERSRSPVDGRIHREYSRAIRSLPPEERRHVLHVAGRPVAPDMHELDPAVRETSS